MPVLVPMSDLMGLSRQVTVLAYQFGAGLTELVTPTNGALMAVTAAAGCSYEDWLSSSCRSTPRCSAWAPSRSSWRSRSGSDADQG